MAVQRLQEGLKTSGHQAAQERTVDLDIADAGRALNPPGRGGADEADLNSADQRLLGHVRHARRAAAGRASVELLSGY
jgi:hypothetical protein